MKHFFKLFFTMTLVLTLVACGGNSDISASFIIQPGNLQATSALVNVAITDEESLITGAIKVQLFDEEGALVSEKSFLDLEELVEVEFEYLQAGTTYEIILTATTGRTNVEVGTYQFTTLALSNLEIKTVEDFFNMEENRNGDYVLMNDIDFSGVEFVSPFIGAFSGSFDGQGYTLKNITITETKLYNGVFGYLADGIIKNVVLENIKIGTQDAPIITTASTKVGIIAGYQANTLSLIENVTVKHSEINLDSSALTYLYVGAIAGESRGKVENITIESTSLNVVSRGQGIVRIGGAIGYVYESSAPSKINADVNVDYRLDAVATTADERSFTIIIGGMFGTVDPALAQPKTMEDFSYSGIILVGSMNFNPLENHKGAYSVLIGGFAGALNRGVKNVLMGGQIALSYVPSEIVTDVYENIIVGGFAGIVNTYDAPEKVVFQTPVTINVLVPESIDIEVTDRFISRLVTPNVDATQNSIVTINQVTLESHVNIVTLENYFDSEWMMELLN